MSDRAKILAMLGRTEFHNISGTRVSPDLVELPSQIMEAFASSSQVWPLFARHYISDKVVPAELLRDAVINTNQFPAMQLHQQCMRSMLDQQYHSAKATTTLFDSTYILRQLTEGWGLCRNEPVALWQTQFTHLASYGGTYYSYIFGKAIADKIWYKLFENDPLSASSGSIFKDQLLKHGGSKDPWQAVSDVLSDPSISGGGQEAMTQVGRE